MKELITKILSLFTPINPEVIRRPRGSYPIDSGRAQPKRRKK